MSTPKTKTIPASRFKAECLALLDEVARTGETLVITKRGRPVAQIAPIPGEEPRSLRGSIVREDDIISPVEADWSASR